MKKSISFNHQSDPNALRKKTIQKIYSQSNYNHHVGDDQGNNNSSSLRIHTTPHPPYPPSPLSKSPWASHDASEAHSHTGLRGSLVREKGHIYSLAACGDLLYTGSESKNIRVWKNQKELSSFKSSSGFVKSIVLDSDRVLSGHQDGKIRIWKPSHKDPTRYKRVGSMPTFKAKIKSSFKHHHHHNSSSLNHLDAISCLALAHDGSVLYSGSWDRTFKVWRVSDSKCLESVNAHDDAVNSIVVLSGPTVLTGSADGSVRVWEREFVGSKGKTKHTLSRTLLQQESAVTALAADPTTAFLYGGSSDGSVVFWKQDGGGGPLSHGGVLRGHKLAVLCLATAGRLVFSGSADTNICVWQRNGNIGEVGHTCLSVLSGHVGPVKCLAVVEDEDEDGKGDRDRDRDRDREYVLYSGSIDKSVKIWRAAETIIMQPMLAVDAAAEDFSNPWADFSTVEGGEMR